MRDLNAGITYINAGTTGAEVHLPFGGHEGHRQRPPRGGAGGARLLHRVEVDLRRLLRQAPAGPDRLSAGALVANRKLVVFVPREALDDVREALFAAGAGRIGDYERCSWYTAGTGHVPRRPGDDAVARRERARGARRRAPARDRLPGRARGRGRRRAARRASVRGARLRPLRARRPRVKARLFTDGGARGNPGPAASAYVLEAEDGTVLAAHGEAIGVATNNVAEYRALVAGLERARDLGVDELEVVSDSELLVKQMRGEYKVKNAALRELSLAGRAARARDRRRPLHGRAPRAQRARRPPRQRGARRGVSRRL